MIPSLARLRLAGHRDVLLLALGQAAAMCCASIMGVTSALVGQMLAADKALATLPLSLQLLATMATTFPASFLMRRFGRRNGFWTGAVFGMLGGAIACWAVLRGDFPMFVLGSAVIGIFNGFIGFYRFAAAEAADPAFRPTAISLVMAGGVLSAILGPELARFGHDLLVPYTFAGCFLVVSFMAALTTVIVLPVRFKPMAPRGSGGDGRPLGVIFAQPLARMALIGAMLGYGLMTFVMTATPLAMQFCGFDFDNTAFIIQSHAVAMFLPSFFTGHLIRRIGELRVMALGTAAYAVMIAVGLSGVALGQFWVALVFLGLGWNFLYVGGTSLLTRCYRPSEAAKVQALNDCLVFTTVAACSLIAGTIQHLAGWASVLLAATVPVGLIVAALLWGWSLRSTSRLAEAAAE